MKYKLLTYAALPIASLAFLGISAASAHGMLGWGGFGMGSTLTPDEIASRQTTQFQQQAQIFGISADDLKNGWAEGKSPAQVAEDKGVSATDIQARMKEAQAAQMKTQLQALVDKGVITQAQADKRLQTMQTQIQKGPGHMKDRGMRGGFGW